MSKVVVTGVGGDIGLPVARILAENGHHVVGADAGDVGHVRAFLSDVRAIAPARDPDFLSSLDRLAREVGADVIVPNVEMELAELLSSARTSSLPCPLMCITPEVMDVCGDKLATSRWLAARGLGTPVSVEVGDFDAPRPPFIAKPRRGSGGRGQIRYTETLAAEELKALGADYFLQEEIPLGDGEITCGVFRAQGETRVIQIKRTLAGGITHRGEVVRIPEVETLCRAIAEGLDLTGSVNVQLRVSPDGPKVFEINPRFSSTVLFRHMLGFQDVLWWLEALDGKSPPPYDPPAGARIYRTGLEVIALPGQLPRCPFS